MVRHQMVARNIGFFRPERKGRLEVINMEKAIPVKEMLRLWCKSADQPKMPPLAARKKLEAEIKR